MKQLTIIAAFVLCTAVASAAAKGPTAFPDPASPKDGQLVDFQLLTESECVNGHFAGLAAPNIAIVPPAMRPASDHGAPGYRIFISCPEGYLRTAVWDPSTNKLSPDPSPKVSASP